MHLHPMFCQQNRLLLSLSFVLSRLSQQLQLLCSHESLRISAIVAPFFSLTRKHVASTSVLQQTSWQQDFNGTLLNYAFYFFRNVKKDLKFAFWLLAMLDVESFCVLSFLTVIGASQSESSNTVTQCVLYCPQNEIRILAVLRSRCVSFYCGRVSS